MILSRRRFLHSAMAAPALLLPSRTIARPIHGTGGGGGGYATQGIRFTAEDLIYLQRGAGIFAVDGKTLLVSKWVANFVPSGSPIGSSLQNQQFIDEPAGGLEGPNGPYLEIVMSDFSTTVECDFPGVDITGTTYHHLLAKVKCSGSTLGEVFQIVVDGTFIPQTGSGPTSSPGHLINGSVPFVWDLTQENDFMLGQAFGNFVSIDMAQYYLAYGDAADIDLSDPANIAKFISGGKAVNLLTSGAPTALVLFDGSGNAFANNQGTAGSFPLKKKLVRDPVPSAGPCSVSLPGAVIGTQVYSVNGGSSYNPRDDATADFETTISVTNQIQQTGTSTDWTGSNMFVDIPGALTDAPTSPPS